MKTSAKIGLILCCSSVSLTLAYFLTPLRQWKKYKENHPSLFETEDEATPKYIDFCYNYWKTFGKVAAGKEDEITYDGGELDEITITAPLITPKKA